MPEWNNPGMTKEKRDALPIEEQAKRTAVMQKIMNRFKKYCPHCGAEITNN